MSKKRADNDNKFTTATIGYGSVVTGKKFGTSPQEQKIKDLTPPSGEQKSLTSTPEDQQSIVSTPESLQDSRERNEALKKLRNLIVEQGFFVKKDQVNYESLETESSKEDSDNYYKTDLNRLITKFSAANEEKRRKILQDLIGKEDLASIREIFKSFDVNDPSKDLILEMITLSLVLKGSPNTIAFFAEKKPSLVTEMNYINPLNKESFLMDLIKKGHSASAIKLIESGFLKDGWEKLADKNGKTVADYVMQSQNVKLIRIIFEGFASESEKKRILESISPDVLVRGDAETISFFARQNPTLKEKLNAINPETGESFLTSLIRSGRVVDAKNLIQSCVLNYGWWDCVDNNGLTVVHWAIHNAANSGNIELLLFLHKQGVDFCKKYKDKDGKEISPIEVALFLLINNRDKENQLTRFLEIFFASQPEENNDQIITILRDFITTQKNPTKAIQIIGDALPVNTRLPDLLGTSRFRSEVRLHFGGQETPRRTKTIPEDVVFNDSDLESLVAKSAAVISAVVEKNPTLKEKLNAINPETGESFLTSLIRSGRVVDAKNLIQSCVLNYGWWDCVDNNGLTIAHYAIESGNIELLNVLLAQEFDFLGRRKDKNGVSARSPIEFALSVLVTKKQKGEEAALLQEFVTNFFKDRGQEDYRDIAGSLLLLIQSQKTTERKAEIYEKIRSVLMNNLDLLSWVNQDLTDYYPEVYLKILRDGIGGNDKQIVEGIERDRDLINEISDFIRTNGSNINEGHKAYIDQHAELISRNPFDFIYLIVDAGLETIKFFHKEVEGIKSILNAKFLKDLIEGGEIDLALNLINSEVVNNIATYVDSDGLNLAHYVVQKFSDCDDVGGLINILTIFKQKKVDFFTRQKDEKGQEQQSPIELILFAITYLPDSDKRDKLIMFAQSLFQSLASENFETVARNLWGFVVKEEAENSEIDFQKVVISLLDKYPNLLALFERNMNENTVFVRDVSSSEPDFLKPPSNQSEKSDSLRSKNPNDEQSQGRDSLLQVSSLVSQGNAPSSSNVNVSNSRSAQTKERQK